MSDFQNSIINLLDKQTLLEWIKKTAAGLRAPADSGAYRHARSELKRLLAPILAILIPTLSLFLMMILSSGQRDPMREIITEIMEPDVIDQLHDLDRVFDEQPDFDPVVFEVPLDMHAITAPDPAAPDTPRPPTPVSFDNVAMVRSPVIIRGFFTSRTDEGRKTGLTRHAGRHGGATENAVIKALEWLKKNQQADGSWEGKGAARSKTAMTGLGLLTFLAHGETPGSKHYGPTVQRAIQFLLDNQNPNGTFKNTEGGIRGGVYAHGIGSYALSEAFALTQIPKVRDAMELAIGHIIKGQRPDGGFDYKFERVTGERDRCSSVAGWMAQAMKAAFLAGSRAEGLEEAIKRASSGFKAQYNAERDMFLYSSKSGALRKSMTPICTLCLQLLGHPDSQEVRNGLRELNNWRPNWEKPDMSGGILEPIYIWYYTTQALFHSGGNAWRRWNENYAPMVVKNQNEDGSWSWSHGRSDAYGPVYHTTLNALSLMVYYRYLPTYQPIEIAELETAVEEKSDIKVLVDI